MLDEEWIGVLRKFMQMEDAITIVGQIMDKYDPQKKIAIAFDEWDASMKGPEITLLKAQLAALAFNTFHRTQRSREGGKYDVPPEYWRCPNPDPKGKTDPNAGLSRFRNVQAL